MIGVNRGGRRLAANPNAPVRLIGDAPHAGSTHGTGGVNTARKQRILAVLNASDVPMSSREVHALVEDVRLDKMGVLLGELIEEGVVISLGQSNQRRYTVAL